jgi:serine/threonine-protein kinase
MMSSMGPSGLVPRDEAADTGVRAGQLLAGKYRVEGVLGVGGMGVVVAATHIHLCERVALKLPLPETLRNPGAVSRFIEEARVASRIKSDHVVRVIDVGTLDNGSPYIVMEYLQGIDLSVWLTQHGTMGVERAVDFVLQACEAIAQVHALGMVHRDVKPANLFCVPGPDHLLSVKLLDFGISTPHVRERAGSTSTPAGAIVGSPLYMSPEQLQSPGEVDLRTDIWSLGVILYELLTGRTPFVAQSIAELAEAFEAPPPPVRRLRPDVPPALERAIATCLQTERDRRFASVSELALALADFGSVRGRTSVERLLVRQRVPSLAGCELGQSCPPSFSPYALAASGRSRASRKSGGRAAMWIGAMASVGVLAAATVMAFHARPVASAPRGASASRAAASADGPHDAAPTVAEAIDIPTVSVSDLPSVPAAAAPSPVPRPTSPLVRASGAASRTYGPGCDPPYVIDGGGRTHFRLECLVNK